MSLSKFDANVPTNSVAMWWLCQAGFAFKTSAGKIVYLDPYLSDAAERMFGFKRLSLSPIAAEEVRADLVVLTHEHADHLDPDALPIIAGNNPKCRFAAPSGCLSGLSEAGVSPNNHILLEAGRQYDIDGVVIDTAQADHGDFSDTALSLALTIEGVRILCTGDTSFRPQLLKPLYVTKPDVLLPCINGAFGNMGPLDAAMLAQAVDPRYAIPCHFGMFAEHGLADPGGFIHACSKFCPGVKTMLLRPGERFVCEKEQ